MEFTSPGAGDMSVFRQLPENIEIGLGCVSCQPGQIDSADAIVERVEAALQAPGAGANHAQSRLRLRPRLGRRGEHRRGLHEAEERSRSRTPPPREVRLELDRASVDVADLDRLHLLGEFGGRPGLQMERRAEFVDQG